MGAWDREFPWRPGHAHAHTDSKAWSSAQVHSKNIGGPVALLPTDQCSRPKIPEPPCRVTAGWGWRARRWPRGPGVPGPRTSPRPPLSVVLAPCTLQRCGLETHPAPPSPARWSSESRRDPPPHPAAGAPGARGRPQPGPVCKYPRGGRGPPPRCG